MHKVSAADDYAPLRCFLNAKILFYCALRAWGSRIWSQHTDTKLHWCMPLTLLKLQLSQRKEFLQRGHISSPRMFKSWDRSSVQTSCAGVFFSLCLSVCECVCLPCILLLFSSHCIRSLFQTSPAHTYQLRESKHSINNAILMHYKTLAEG